MSEPAPAGRRRPGPARSLSREQIVATGLEVMARDGLRNVSFRTIGMRLGVDPKALYTYVTDKDDLLTAMFDTVVASVELPQPDDPRPPEDRLLETFARVRDLCMQNLDLFQLARPTLIGGDWSGYEGVWAALTEVATNERQAAELWVDLVQVTIGSATESAQSATLQSAVTTSMSDLDPTTHPGLTVAVHAYFQVDREKGFERLIRRALEGAGAEGPNPAQSPRRAHGQALAKRASR